MKKWIVFAVFIVGALAVLLFTQDRNTVKPIDLSNINQDSIIAPNTQDGNIGDHLVGDTQAKVVLVEYGDYQCSACASHSQTLIDLAKSYESDLALVYRHYPIPGHANARAAAAAAEAAGKQGKFWEMHSKLFQNYLYWGTDINGRDGIFQSYANELGLNIEQFKQDVASEAIKQKIDFDTALGKAHNLKETPTLVLNGKKLAPEIWSDEQKLKEAIKQKIENSN